MNSELVAVLGLVAIFGLSMWRNINMGAIGLVAAFLLGVTYFGLDTAAILSGFPGSLFVTLVGVTFLFGIARANGTVDRLVAGAVTLVRGRIALVPWVFFVLAALITGIGAISAATNAILVPIALAFAYRYRINPLLLGLCVLNGTNAGGFSPISVYFSIVDGALSATGITVSPGPIFLLTLIANTVLNAVAFFLLGGRALIARGRETVAEGESTDSPAGAGDGTGTPAHAPGGPTTTATSRRLTTWTPMHLVTVAVVLTIVVLTLTLDLDVGFLALSGAVLLALLWPQPAKEATTHIGWQVVLLIGGMVTYIGVLQEAGVVEDLASTVNGIGTPVVAALVLLAIGGVVSAFASTNAMFVILVPLAAPLLLAGELGLVGFVAGLCVASSAVDSSPFSTGGALMVANGQEADRDRIFRGLLWWTTAMVVAAPLLSWVAFVLLWP